MGMYTKGAWSGSSLAASVQFQGAFSTTFSWSHAAISSGQYGGISIASTTADVMPGDLFQVEITPTTNVTIASWRTSTDATSRVTVVLTNVGSTATSTFSGTGRITWIKLGLT